MPPPHPSLFLSPHSLTDTGPQGLGGRQRAFNILQMAGALNLPVSHSPPKHKSPGNGGGGGGSTSPFTPTATPINHISYLALSGYDCTLKSATKTSSIMPHKSVSRPTSSPKNEKSDWGLKTAFTFPSPPSLPLRSMLSQAVMRTRAAPLHRRAPPPLSGRGCTNTPLSPLPAVY